MRLFLYAHGGSSNHGCEAIVRTTASIFDGSDIELYSYRISDDYAYGLDAVCQITDPKTVRPNKTSLAFLRAYLALKLKGDHLALDLHHERCVLSQRSKNSIALSVGGDNYCCSSAGKYMDHRALLERLGVKTVLWGCSVEPDMIDREMRKDLSRYDLITARESITYEALKRLNPNTILVPDPAFTLSCGRGRRPDGSGMRGYIGINVSPLVQELEQSNNITIENYRSLISHILDQTDRDVMLIPHVVWEGNDDRIPLGRLYEEFKDTGRIFLVEDQNCMQLKDIISGCEFFVGARTHATIAAYSTCVPTLVVGYSVKARGIARDLFGSEEGYVLPVQQLKEKEDLTNAFKSLYSRKDEIRKHLTDMMPGYIRGIDAAREAVQKL
ncbi:MAG: polysaccharide pyruvyl transferase family protein [Oscillospiraceae bacterium]|nr:polysaccharide pyruvyl transferase family protein [Bacteroidales bacterium]MBQ9761488.1 polysaccharide pyruvyl transferase family protein [Oscillospiraceae bacterium]